MLDKRTVTYQDLWDFLDGTLRSPQAKKAVESVLMRDEALAAEFSLMRAQHRILSQTGCGVLDEKVPQRLLDVVDRARPNVCADKAR